MSYAFIGAVGAVFTPAKSGDSGTCYVICEELCMEETGGLYVPFVTTYCAADCYDNSGCADLPYSHPEEYDLPGLPATILPPKPSSEEPASTKPTTSGGGTKPSSSNGGKKPSSSSTTKKSSDDDEPSPVAPSGAKIGVVLLGLSAAIFGGVWWMRRRKR